MSTDAYLGNPNLKKVNTPVEFTKENIIEFQKCEKDPIYFMENYMKIVSLDEGLVPFKMYDFQKTILQDFHNNRFHNIQKKNWFGPRPCFTLRPRGWLPLLTVSLQKWVRTPKCKV